MSVYWSFDNTIVLCTCHIPTDTNRARQDSHGLQVILTCVHNVTAPLSMLFCMIMETVQLGYGETLAANLQQEKLRFHQFSLTMPQRVPNAILACV